MTKQRSNNTSNKGAADLTALFRLPTSDIADRLNAMLDTERKSHYRCRDYLQHDSSCSTTAASSSSFSRPSRSRSRSSRSRSSRRSSVSRHHGHENKETVTPTSRAKIVQWLNDCVDYLELPRECVAVAMSYVDRFMSSSDSTSSKFRAKAKQDATVYQLIAISSLFLATKQTSHKLAVVDADVLARISHGSYSMTEIVDMETTILKTLEWRLCGATPQTMAHHAIALLAKLISNKRRIASVVDFTRLQIELAVSDYSSSVLRLPSEVAVASVLNSMDLLDFTEKEKRALDRALFDWTGLDVMSVGIEEAREELQDVFDRQSSDVLSRATVSTSSQTGSDSNSSRKKKNESFYSTRSPVCVVDEEFERKSRRSSRSDGKSRSRSCRRVSSRRQESRRIPLEP